MIPHPIEAPLGLGSREDGWIWVLGFGVRMRGESSGMSRAGHGKGEREGGERRQSDLNAVRPKTTSSGQTGQTGRPYRSDRSGLNWPRLTETILVLCRVVWN